MISDMVVIDIYLGNKEGFCLCFVILESFFCFILVFMSKVGIMNYVFFFWYVFKMCVFIIVGYVKVSIKKIVVQVKCYFYFIGG